MLANELLRLEGSSLLGAPCSYCTEEPGLFRCLECHPERLSCKTCVLASHAALPFHRVEKWENKHFTALPLVDIEAVYHLSHDNTRCPHWKAPDPPAPPTYTPNPDAPADDRPKKRPRRPQTSAADGHIVRIAHTNGFHHVRIGYCRCPNAPDHATQLLRARIFPGTLSKPRTAYTIALLSYFLTSTWESNLTAYDYAKILCRLTHSYCPEDIKSGYDNFRVVLRVWRDLQFRMRCGAFFDIPARLPPPYTNTMAVLCPGCPHPGINYDPAVKHRKIHCDTLTLAGDGNFRAVQKDKISDPADVHLRPGAAYFREDKAYHEYLASVGDEHEVSHLQPSTCTGLKAGDVLREGRYKNTKVSGVFSVICARHGFFRPDATVDLQKGERYSHTDYALAGALAGTQSIRRIVFIYDINCQYIRHVHERFKERFPHLTHIEFIEWLIPKMHLVGHKEDCQYLYSLNFTPGSGRVDGEQTERNWCDLNGAATSTREMNSAHRHEVMEDKQNEMNFKKMINLRTLCNIQRLAILLTQISCLCQRRPFKGRWVLL
ncbi:hypothetical protein BOTBODRAFT_120331 [Botryobasidium botryosum FD-172 SS1]|uniref:CxC2-like cysteine cluster KDZ transposase-associated domain-containing protein n=1 Tax=Botryobasidium botryosum (strain FD-172 SS1) TaxID=930990 RepID=A0A067LXZ0_BOTB1|nr:hypothetical protein BOTBODRAFT_120331 [Botryobasidium botryosum FD-172 SS1]